MGIFDKFFSIPSINVNSNKNDVFEEWVKSASEEELLEKLEENRQNWLKTGNYGPTEKVIQKELHRRLEEAWENDPHRNKESNYQWSDKNRWE